MKIEDLRKKFCKDCGYKISVYSDELFFNQLAKIEGAIESYDAFEEMVIKYGGCEDFLTHYDTVRDKAIDCIKQSEGYEKFNKLDMREYNVINSKMNKVIYHSENIGKSFLSIDMKKANFNSLKYFDKSIFNNKQTWEDFLAQFTEEKYIINSKNIRQVIMGRLNPPRQEKYEKYLMNQLWEKLKIVIKEEDLVSFNKDELVIDISDTSNYNKIKDRIKKIVSEFSLPTEIEEFKLCGVLDKETNKIYGYYKKFDNGYEFKAIDNKLLNIAKKTLDNEKIEDEDLIFEDQFGLVKLLTPPQLKCIECNYEKEKNKGGIAIE